MLLKEVPVREQPREKLLLFGQSTLTNEELVAILLRTGFKDCSVLDVARKVICLLEDVSDLSNITVQELTSIKGVGSTKAITLLAAVELGRRIAVSHQREKKLTNPQEIFDFFDPMLKDEKQEKLYVIYLDVKMNLIAYRLITVGGINSTFIENKVIFKWAYKYSASSMILIHNHPSGDPNPSSNDIIATQNIVKDAKMLGFKILDHIVIGNDYFSMREMIKTIKIF